MDGIDIARRLIGEEREKKTGFLDLGNLGLSELPPEVLELSHLSSLNLGTWYFDAAGRSVRSANGLVKNALNSLPDGLGALGQLRALSLVENAMGDLRPVQSLTALTSLSCVSTKVSDLTPLRGLSALKTLACSSTPVSDLSPLQSLTTLTSVACSNTQVSDLGPLESTAALESLSFQSTKVTDLRSLRGLTALRFLTCSGTRVSDLSPLESLTELESLDCASTLVSDLSPLETLTALGSLSCWGTRVRNLGPLRALTGLEILGCWHTLVSDLIPLEALTRLTHLFCAGMPVSDLTPLRALKALRYLDCSNCLVSDLNPLRTLAALHTLDCSDTPVSDLSPLSSLTTLESLNCSGTHVSDLSPLQTLTTLRKLSCALTQVRDLSPLKALPALESLDCSHTVVSELDALIGLPVFKTLRANKCRLSDLPINFVRSETLTDLFLQEATVPGLPAELLSAHSFSSCLGALRSHLTDLEAGAEEITEAKLVVLGNGRVGKTQVCRRLRGLPYDETVPSTHGITVTAGRWSGSTADEALNIWDFGGQDIYHGAHALFMETHAVFLIVWHPDFETAGEQTVDGLLFRNYPLPYWLEYVRTLGRRDCPVIVMQARCDRPEQEVRRLPVDDAFLDFTSLKPCWYSAKTNRGRGALEDALRDGIQSLRERDGIATIGAGRMRVLRQLEAWRNDDHTRPTGERQHRTLSQAEFRTLCDQVGGVSSPDRLLSYLHNLGVVFYQPSLFQDRIIVDQSWALEAVYAVFDRAKAYPLILSQGGRFTESLLAMTAWRDYSEPERRLFLSLMESCGIAFTHREADRRLGLETEYLAPDLLTGREMMTAQLAGRWNGDEQTWRLEYEYPFLHGGLMRALLCDIGQRSHEAGVYWKYGVWVYEESTGCRALLEQQMTDDRRGRITLRVQGHQHQELATWVRDRIERRNRLFGYAELKPAVDEFTAAQPLRERVGSANAVIASLKDGPSQRTPVDHIRGADAAWVASEPTFDKPPASFFPSRKPQVFVSYAWGDDTPAGKLRAKVVDDLCRDLGRQGVKVRRDRDEMRPGDLISEFMDRLTGGDFVLAVISDKYLRSEYCMYELFRIYRNCADQPGRFLGTVIPLILPDARLDRPTDRLLRAIYWKDEETQQRPLVEQNVEAVGTEFFRKFKLIGEFARNTSNMLEYLVDRLQPRDFDRQAAEGFREVLSQIQRQRPDLHR